MVLIMRLDRIIAVRNDKSIFRDGELCMKVFVSGHSKSEILAEALNQARAEETGLAVPTLREVSVLDGKWTITSDYIRGSSLERLAADEPENKNRYIRQLIDLQLETQSKPCRSFPSLSERLGREINGTDLDAELKKSLFKRLYELSAPECSLCHGDFSLSNVILSEDDNRLYILDWAHAAKGSSAADAARTYLLFRLSDDENGAEKYLSLFTKKSGVEKKLIRSWLPVSAAAMMPRLIKERSELLLEWIKVTLNNQQ